MAVLVKLLSGGQAGAELALAPGDYVLGSSADADLVLVDAAVRARHAILRITDAACLVEPLDGAEIRVAGKPAAGQSPVAPYQVITLGGVNLALGPDGPWKELPAIPAPLQAEPEPAPARPDAPSDASGTANAAPAAEAAAPAPRLAAPDAGRRGGVARLALPALALVALAAAAWAAFPFLAAWFRPPEADFLEFAARTLRGQGVRVSIPATGRPSAGTVELAGRPDGKLMVSGLLMTRRERLAIAESPLFSSGQAVFNLNSAEEEADTVNAELARRHPGAILALEEGTASVRLSGLVNRLEDAAAAYRLARNGLDPRIPIRRGLLVWAELRRSAEREAGRLGLAGVRFELREGEIVLEAADWPEPRQLEDLLEALRASLGEMAASRFVRALATPPRTAVKPALPPPPLPELDIQAAAAGHLEKSPPIRKDAPETAPESEPKPVPGPKPEPEPESPPEPVFLEWRVAEVFPGGFIDQSGNRHTAGERLTPTLRVEGAWRRGAVLKRGTETILVGVGGVIREAAPSGD